MKTPLPSLSERVVLPVALRPGSASDHEAMYRLDRLCFEPPFRFSRKAMAAFASQDGAFTLLAESGNDLLGFLIVQFEPGPGREAYLVTLDVHPSVRRNGIAGHLLREAERLACEGKAQALSLDVWSDNQPARSFYERLGYVPFGTTADYYGPGRDAIRYRRALDSLA